MRIIRHVVRLTAAVLSVSAAAATSNAQVVQYYTTGSFTCGAGCTGTGTNTATFGGATLTYLSPAGSTNPLAASTAANPASVDLNVLNPSFASFGILDFTSGSGALNTLNGSLTINFFQQAPSTGTGTLVGSLSGQIGGTASNASFVATSDTLTIGDVSYRFRETNYSLVPQSTNNGLVTLQGQISSTGFNGGPGGTVVPEPATMTLLGSGMALTGLIAARRRRAAVA